MHKFTYIFRFVSTHAHTHIHLYIQRTSAEIRGFQRQLTPMEHSLTQILELKIILSNVNNLFYKSNLILTIQNLLKKTESLKYL